MEHEHRGGVAKLLDVEEIEGVLSGSYYRAEVPAPTRPVLKSVDKPTHYKVICISMYTKDLERLDQLVDQMKSRGYTKANRSALIRAALDQMDLDKVPRGI